MVEVGLKEAEDETPFDAVAFCVELQATLSTADAGYPDNEHLFIDPQSVSRRARNAGRRGQRLSAAKLEQEIDKGVFTDVQAGQATPAFCMGSRLVDFGAGHAFTPTTATITPTITQGQSIAIANLSGQTLRVTSNPDLGTGIGSQLYHLGKRKTILFTDDWTYVFTAQEYPNTHLTIVVKNGPQK